MKLIDIPRMSELHGLEPNGDKDGVVIYDHPDGMYSYCYIKGQEDKILHLSLSMPVKKVGDHYEVDHG